MPFQMPASSLKLGILRGLRLAPRCVPAGVQDPWFCRRKRAKMVRNSLHVTERDEAIVDALSRRVRVLSVAQAARHWWPHQRHSKESALTRLQALENQGLVTHFVEWAHPELPLTRPLLVWTPSDNPPDFGPLSYRLRSRWTKAPRPTTGFIATKAAGSAFAGSGGRRPRPSEMTHDLHLTAVFLRLLAESPSVAESWVSEAAQYAAGGGRDERLPDALIRTKEGVTVVEFGGAYSKRKLAEFHEHCAERSLPYELW